VISIKTDQEVKKNAQKLAKELGLSLSDVLNSSLRNFVKTREVYFSAMPRMTLELERILGGIEEDVKETENLSKSLSSSAEVNSYLNNL